MQQIVNRLQEPSTWAGLSILLGLFGVPPAIIPVVGKAGAAVAAAAAVFLPEKSAK